MSRSTVCSSNHLHLQGNVPAICACVKFAICKQAAPVKTIDIVDGEDPDLHLQVEICIIVTKVSMLS
jgi:hypothetical protein